MPNLRSKYRAGFSLVEVIIGFAVLSLVVASSYMALSQVLFVMENGKMETAATELMRNELEVVRSKTWAQLEAISGNSQFESAPVLAKYENTFTGTRTLGSSRGRADQKELQLKVKWTDPRGNDHEVSAVTLLTQNGLQQ